MMGRGVVAIQDCGERGCYTTSNWGEGKTKRRTIRTTIYWHDNSCAADVVAMMTMVVVYSIVTVETRAGKMVRAILLSTNLAWVLPCTKHYMRLSSLVLHSAQRGFSMGTALFPSHQNPAFHFIHIDSTHAISRELEFGLITLWCK